MDEMGAQEGTPLREEASQQVEPQPQDATAMREREQAPEGLPSQETLLVQMEAFVQAAQAIQGAEPADVGASPHEDQSGQEGAGIAPQSPDPLTPQELDELLRKAEAPWMLTPSQIGALLSAIALASPAALGGMPMLPVTADIERRRQRDEIEQTSESTVGVHQDAQAAATALALSQQRLAAVTREVEHSTSRTVTEADVVHAAHLVATGEASPHQRQQFRSALDRVANDTVDLFILASDEQVDQAGVVDSAPDDDLEAWLAEF